MRYIMDLKYKGAIFIIILLSIFSLNFLIPSNFTNSNALSEEIGYSAKVCVSTTGSFQGRKTEAHNGIIETVECDHNILFNEGRNMTRNYCTSCGTIIFQSAYSDPYLCRECERILDRNIITERFAHLDNVI